MSRYEYKFVRVEGDRGFCINIAGRAEYQEVIRQHAEEGWRLVQIFAPATEGFGAACDADVIFDRVVDE
jgi:hypothetical protein